MGGGFYGTPREPAECPRLPSPGVGGAVDGPHMRDEPSIRHVGPCEIHDAHVIEVLQQDSRVEVRLKDASGTEFTIAFEGVEAIAAVRPVGMMVYSLLEMGSAPPLRRFVFANWDEESEASLEIVAAGFGVSR